MFSLLEVEGQGFLREYWSILTDPAHVAVEITLTILIDGLLLGLLWPMIKTYLNGRLQRQHAMLDAEHGISHHADHVHRAPGAVAVEECEDVRHD